MALFVYATVATSKFPSWSDFWKERRERLPVELSQREFKTMLSDFQSFESGLKVRTERILAPLHRLTLRRNIIKELTIGYSPYLPYERKLMETDSLYIKDIQNGIIEKDWDDFDENFLDGLISATMSGNFDAPRLSKFSSLANIDWEFAVDYLTSKTTSESILLRWYFGILRDRFGGIETCQRIKAYCSDNKIPPEVSSHRVEKVIGQLDSAKSTIHEQYNKVLYLRESLRWLEVKSQVGVEEIYLLDNSGDIHKLKEDRLLLDIPFILQHGSDEDFDRLMKLLASSHTWIRETCVQLQGTTEQIKQVMNYYSSDVETARNAAREIQQTIKRIFGDHDSIRRAFSRQIDSENRRRVATVFDETIAKLHPELNETAQKFGSGCDKQHTPAVELASRAKFEETAFAIHEDRISQEAKQKKEKYKDEEEISLLTKSTKSLLWKYLNTA